MSNSIDSLLNETRVFNPSDAFVELANVSGMAGHKAMILTTKIGLARGRGAKCEYIPIEV